MRTALFNEMIHHGTDAVSGTVSLSFMLTENKKEWGNTVNIDADEQLRFLLDFILSPDTKVIQSRVNEIRIISLEGSSVSVSIKDVSKGIATVTTSNKYDSATVEFYGSLMSVICAGEVIGIFPIDTSCINS